MRLTLNIAAAAGTRPVESRHVFTEEGGTIGRAASNSWVLTHNKVSGSHAVISFRNGVFYIEDTSRNGVSINSPDNRLVRQRPYALKSGDVIFVEPYEIDVIVDAGSDSPFEPLADLFSDSDPFAPARIPQVGLPDIVPPPHGGEEVDPLKFFDSVSRPAPSRPPDPVVPPVDDWLGEHYRPPVAVPDPTPPPPSSKSGLVIPPDYDPLAPDSGIAPAPEPPLPPPVEPPRRPKLKEPRSSVAPPARMPLEPFDLPPAEPLPSAVVPPPVVAPPVPPLPLPAAPVPMPMLHAPASPPRSVPEGASRDLADVLAGAGLPGAPVTPELAKNLGEILRVVVAGLIDVLQSRQRIKEEFRIRQTVFRSAENNPLKFSANVEDALHNLLVKRNAAYLGPVEAFADAFDDLRDHQLAMLAGMRVAFETMLADSDPDRMQDEFDRQLGKVSLPIMPAKMRYWDLYREKRQEMKKDPEAVFARLFGEEFARAYEEQFRELRAQRRARAAEKGKDRRPPQT